MSLTLAFLGDFGGAVDFVFHERDSVSGGVQIGGPGEIGELTVEHLKVSVVAMAAACAISIPIGLYLGHRGKGEFVAVTVSNVGRAVPAVVLLFFFLAYLGIGFTNVVAVLFLLAVPPILTNTYVGVRQIDPEIVDAAHGIGMGDVQVVRRVRLPLAMPTIFAGIRTSAVSVVATATIAPLANVQTLGEPIVTPQTYGFEGQLGAALVVTVLTLLIDAGIGALQRVVTPEGVKLAGEPAAARRWFSLPTRRREPAT
ncbi:MAG: ABC transporter permease [Thermoleophilaceae bacterium]